MRLNSIHLINFRQHADTRIGFDTGLTGIVGPNGSGKTTILEAITWAIYGHAAVRGTRDTIRFNRAGARAAVRVELDFDLGGHRYRIVRGLTNAEMYLDGASTPIANSLTAVTELVGRRIGMSREEFFNTYFTGQKELSVMAAMGPSERAQFLSHVLGYERLRAAQRLLRERRSGIAAEITGLRQGMPDPEAVRLMLTEATGRLAAAREKTADAQRRKRDAEAALAAVTPRWEAAQQERDRFQELLSELRVAQEKEAALSRDADRLRRELEETATARAQLERLELELAPFAELAAEFQRLEVLAREEGRRSALLASQEALSEELTKLRERRLKLENTPRLQEEAKAALEAKRRELEDVDAQLEARRTEWVRDRQEAETKRQALREQYHDLKRQRDGLAAAGEDGVCPTCTRPLGGSLRSVLELLDAQMETVRVDGNYYKLRLEQLLEMPDDVRALDERRRAVFQEVGALERRLTKLQLAVHELEQLSGDVEAKEDRSAFLRRELEAIPPGYDRERHEEVRRRLERLSPLDDKAARFRLQIEREPKLLRESRRVSEGLEVVRRRLDEIGSTRDALAFSEKEFGELRRSYERAVEARRVAELAAVAAEGDAVAARAAMEAAESAARALATRQQVLASLTARRRLHDELDRAYTDLRTDLNFQLRPELSELASAFLSELTDGRYTELELDDQYHIVVLEDGLPTPVISGGEEDIANLALRLAISQMIAERAGQPFSLLVLDEIFGSLDDLRRANVLELLRRLQDRFEQIILITHVESIREGMDHVVAVRYDEERGAASVTRYDGAESISVPYGTSAEAAAPLFEGAGAAD